MSTNSVKTEDLDVLERSSPRGFDFAKDEPDFWLSSDLLRFVVAPIVVAVLFAGSVYWIKVDVPDPAAIRDAQTKSIVEVHLLPRPNPLPIPAAHLPTSAIGTPNNAAALVDHASLETSDRADESEEQKVPAEPAKPATSSSVSPSTPTTSKQNAAVAKFRQALLRRISLYQRYPKAAEPSHLQGTVDTIFSISRNGRVLGVWVRTSSGTSVLDQAAIETIRRAQPLPPIPAGLPDPLTVEVALGFDPS